jgi:cytochrome c556
MRFMHLMLAVSALAILAGSDVIAQDQPPAKGVVAVRQATMKANGGHMAAIKAILTEYPDAMGQVTYHAAAVRDVAAYIPTLFPAGSDQPPTAALPPVWGDPAGFKAAADKAEVLARRLVDAANGQDAQATLAAFATLGKEGCGGCHDTFRKKER